MSRRLPSEPSVDEQALRFLRPSPHTTGQTPQAMACWLRRSPEHVAAVLRHRMLTTELRALDPERQIDVNIFLARAKAASTIVPWPGPTPAEAVATVQHEPVTYRRSWALRAAAALGAVALLTAVFLGIGHWRQARPAVYSTGVGQHRELALPDGSTLELNTQSAVQIQFSRSTRDVYLLAGEALFAVRHNAQVPFRVHVGATVIEDVGTQFNVRRGAGLTTVSVLEGSVQVSTDDSFAPSPAAGTTVPMPTVVVASKDYQRLSPHTQLAAGEQMRIVADGTLIQRQQVDVGEATAWRSGRLVFSDATLEDIVAEFNRYNAPQIVLVGDAHRARRYSGVFDATDPQSFLEYLRRDDAGLTIQNDAGGLVIRGPSDRNEALPP